MHGKEDQEEEELAAWLLLRYALPERCQPVRSRGLASTRLESAGGQVVGDTPCVGQSLGLPVLAGLLPPLLFAEQRPWAVAGLCCLALGCWQWVLGYWWCW